MQLSPQTFDQEFNKCNPEQQQAIKQTEGTVMVIAGPGTGKTQILALRICEILKTNRPKDILCLTYTEAGANAMHKRLEQFIGSAEKEIAIFTYHAFCKNVIDENRTYFGDATDLDLISELESIELFHELIDNIPAGNVLKRYTGDVYYDYYRLKNLFSIIKKEYYEPINLIQCAEKYIESLPNLEEFQYKKDRKPVKKGDPNPRLIDEETGKINQFIAGVALYEPYLELMKSKKRYDYDDMIQWVIRAFKENDELLAKYQERFLYILADEFQDTNGSQMEILNLLNAYWEDPNLFVVGDDDQSIYSFQGAENERIREFVRKYAQKLFPIVLTSNYRSSQEILDISKSLIENNQTRLIYDATLKSIFENQNRELNKNLIAKNPKFELKSPFPFGERVGIGVFSYPNPLHELGFIVNRLIEAKENNENLSEFAIIYRSHKDIQNYIKVFDHLKIPYNAKRRTNILELPFIQKIIKLLTYLEEERYKPGNGDYLIFELLHFDFFGIDYQDIRKLAVVCAKDYKEPAVWRKTIGNKNQLFELGLVSASAISKLVENLALWQKSMYNETIQVLFEQIITKGGIIAHIMNLEEKIWYLEILTSFFDHIKEESVKNPKITLKKLLDDFKKMEDYNIPIEIEKLTYAQQGVNLMTAHGSKGLEFETVFLINTIAPAWEKSRSQTDTFKFPPFSKLDLNFKEDEKEKKEEEERRLFYVALTRAKQNLQISYPINKVKNDKELEKSKFVSEIIEKTNLEPQTLELTNEEITKYASLALFDELEPNLKPINDAYIQNKLKNYSLSVTHLNKYLSCKLSFYFENILQIPQARSESMGFGSAIHGALENIFRDVTQNGQFPSIAQFIAYFDKAILKYESHFTPEQLKRRKEYARELLPAIYNDKLEKWNKITRTEYNLTSVVVDGVPINGKLDKLEFTGKQINVVDYKTGRVERAKPKLNPPKPDADLATAKFEEIYGGDYWRQIVFYKILMDNDNQHPEWEMVSGEMEFVEPDKKGEFYSRKFYPNAEEIAFVKSQIRSTYQGIINHDFYKGCGKEDCRWCNFVKENYQKEWV
jgi:DNA helicase II / ATP-dependent DNA helicase PcrA